MLEIRLPQLSLDAVLEHRNITPEWLNASKSDFLPTSLMKNAEAAADFIKENINKKWGILIDADADGITSSAIALVALERLGATNVQLIKFEGKVHGIDRKTDLLPEVDVLLIPDAATNDVEDCKILAEKGVKVLTCDHHEQEVENPYALIVNPHQKGCEYPNKGLSGGTVTWKVFSQLVNLDDYLDLCAISTVGDRMPLSSLENIAFTREGLANLHNPFLLAHFAADKRLDGKPLDAMLVGWYLAPLINAGVRMGTSEDVIEIVEAMAGKVDGHEAVDRLLKLRGQQNRKIDMAVPTIVLKTVDDANIVMAIRPPSLPKTTTGLVCNRLVGHYGKPVLLGSIVDGYYSGSARNIDNASFGLKETLAATGLMDFVAGHSNAHGFGIKEEDIPKLKEALSALNVSEKKITVDGFLNSMPQDEIIPFLFAVHELAGWFECDIPEFSLGLAVDDNFTSFTTMKDRHCKAKWNGIDLVQFGTTEPFKKGEILIVKTSINSWQGRDMIQLMVNDRVTV